MDITNNELNGINGTKGMPIEEAVDKINKDVWDEMTETELARTVVALVGCVSELEKQVIELKNQITELTGKADSWDVWYTEMRDRVYDLEDDVENIESEIENVKEEI